MTPKEKAINLVDNYRTHIRAADQYGYLLSSDEIHIAKQCAIIAVEEIAKLMHESGNRPEFTSGYWKQVKSEIEQP